MLEEKQHVAVFSEQRGGNKVSLWVPPLPAWGQFPDPARGGGWGLQSLAGLQSRASRGWHLGRPRWLEFVGQGSRQAGLRIRSSGGLQGPPQTTDVAGVA